VLSTQVLVKDKKADLLADSHSTLYRRKNYFCQLLNVHDVNDVRQTEMHAAEILVPESSCSEVETAIQELKRYKLPAINQMPADLIQVGGNILRSEIHKLLTSVWNKV
jgi:hypothetical protein